MRSGRHFAQFTVVHGEDAMFGVVWPDRDVAEGRWRSLWSATAFMTRPMGATGPAGATGNGCRP